MFKNVCIDANIFLSLLLDEAHTKRSLDLFKFLEEKDIAMIEPTFLSIEVISTIRNKEYSKTITSKQAREMISRFEKLDLSMHETSDTLLERAYWHAALSNQPVIYDCLYSALAEQEQAFFVTRDDRFLNSIKKLYTHSYSIAEALEIIEGKK